MNRELTPAVIAVIAVLSLATGGALLTERLRTPRSVPRTLPAPGPGERRVVLEIDGMSCAACAASIAGALEATPGVRACALDATAGRAEVVVSGTVADTTLVLVVARAGEGYSAAVGRPMP